MDKTANTRPNRLRSAWSFFLELFSTGQCLVWWVRVTVVVIVNVAIRVSKMSGSNYNPQPLEVETVELLKHAGDEIVNMPTGICQRIWQTKTWSEW